MGSLIPRPESHDEDGRDSMEKTVAEEDERLVLTMSVISCQGRV